MSAFSAAETWRCVAGWSQAAAELPGAADRIWLGLAGELRRHRLRAVRGASQADEIAAELHRARERSEASHAAWLAELAARSARADRPRELVTATFAAIGETIRRELGLELHREQLLAALALHDGHLVEMPTGEGKTVTAALPVVLLAWRRRGCHLVTANDYLAGRDAAWLAPVYEAAGLRVASIAQDATPEQRRRAYRADVTYATHQELTADHLRDRVALGAPLRVATLAARSLLGSPDPEPVTRGCFAAVVDEADSVLIDDAVTPLLLSREGEAVAESEVLARIDALARELRDGHEIRVIGAKRRVVMRPAGEERIREAIADGLAPGLAPRRARAAIQNALAAHHAFQRDDHYVVSDGKVVIVDESTGRQLPDRTWSDGLHQAVEVKEGLEPRGVHETAARLGFQRYFRRYTFLCGMTGTASEARHELREIYGLEVVPIPSHRPCQRRHHALSVATDDAHREEGVVAEALVEQRRGRPVLIGTPSVRDSEAVAERLRARGIEPRVLNAREHADEAAIVAEAGARGAVTVATHMAGRGTDIPLAAGVAELGGLHVIAHSAHASHRVDRQLFGRAGRQGDPGSAHAWISLEDPLVRLHAGPIQRAILAAAAKGRWLGLAAPCVRELQNRAARSARRRRRERWQAEERADRSLAFASSARTGG